MWQRFELHAASPEAGERDHWQDSFELQIAAAADGRERESITLLVRGAAMPQGARLMVFDDITELVSAQRVEAWSEVARRLAHEIKNPLTPIQLSAERLQHKLGGKLEGSRPGDARALGRDDRQPGAGDEDARQRVPRLRPPAGVELRAARPQRARRRGARRSTARRRKSGRLRAELAEALPAIVGDGTQLRQVIHNLVQNALDAVAEQADGRVRIVTEAAQERERRSARGAPASCVDNGPGFSEKVLKRAFEPYVTTKTKGTGLGLAVVKKIADEHGARVRIANLGTPLDDAGDAAAGQRARGASFAIIFQTRRRRSAVAASEPVATSRAH